MTGVSVHKYERERSPDLSTLFKMIFTELSSNTLTLLMSIKVIICNHLIQCSKRDDIS